MVEITLRFRAVFLFAALSLLAGLLFLIYEPQLLDSLKFPSALQHSHDTERLFQDTLHRALQSGDPGISTAYFNHLLSHPELAYVRLSTLNGSMLAEQHNASLQVHGQGDTNGEANRIISLQTEIQRGGKPLGYLQIGVLPDRLHPYRAVVLSAVSGILLMLTYLYLLKWRLARRLQMVSQRAAAIADGDLEQHLPVSGHGPFTTMLRSLNKLITQLKQRQLHQDQHTASLLQRNTELETRVLERTQQLEKLNRQLEYQTLHDPLTKLPNRLLFLNRLQHLIDSSQRNQQPFALICIDLDIFKEINDSMGHQTGDLVLQHVAGCCMSIMRDADTLARVGGDEFMVLLPVVTDMQSAQRVAVRLLDMIHTPTQIEDRPIKVSASLGVALYPEHGDSLNELLLHADAAMSEAKRKQLGVVIYHPELGKVASEQLLLRNELTNGIQSGELLLHYQPKIDFGTLRINGVEALVRWQHPRLGLLSPDKFIALSERYGLIKPLTHEVVKLALQQIHQWHQMKLELPVAINISALNLQDHDFPEWLQATLEQFHVPAPLLELEVTETAIMTEPLTAIENITKLSSLGIQVAIDDFGTGYSSMAYLQKLLVAKIKIDRTFVMDMANSNDDTVIVQSTIELAHNLGLKTVAEGVEDEQVWQKLKALGCDAAQGYFLSKPLRADHLLEWLSASRWGIDLPPPFDRPKTA